jgi:O-antigen/teichoic acid export membrane protein
MRQLAKVADNVVALLVRQVLTWSLTAVLMVFFLPRLLGDAGLGKITFAIAVITILLVVTNLGTATFTVKQVALDSRRVSDILWHAYALRLVMGLVAGAVILLVTHLSGLDNESKWVLSIASLTLIVMGLDAAQIAALQGLENMRRIAMAEVAGKATLLVLGVAVLETGHGVVAYALAMLCGSIVGFLVNFSYLATRHLRRPSLSPAVARYLIVGGLPFLMTGAIMQFYTWSDTLTLRFLTRDAVVGWYGAANQLYATMNFVPLVIITALLPALTRFHAQDRATMRVAVEKGMLAILTTGIPLAAGSLVLSGELIGFLRYPAEFRHSVPLLATLALTLPVTGSLMLVGTVAIAADRQKEWAITVAITSIISLAINIPFIIFFDRVYGNGALGVTIAAVLSEVLMVALGIRLVPAGIMGRSILVGLARCLAASAAMAAVLVGVKMLRDPGFVPLVMLGVAVYFISLLALRGITIAEVKFLLRAALSRGQAAEEVFGESSGILNPKLGREGA